MAGTASSQQVVCGGQSPASGEHMRRVSHFVSFCIEAYIRAHNLPATTTVELLRQYGVLDFLADCYESETTRLWPECFVEDMDAMIDSRKGDANEAVSR